MHALGAALAFSGVGACVKLATAGAEVNTVVFARNLVALCVLLPWLLRARRAGLATARPGSHLLRAAFGLAAMYCFFRALSVLGLGEAMVLNYSTPLFIPFVAWLWIRERPSPLLLPVIGLGLLGVLLILRPDTLLAARGDAATEARLFGLASGLLAALAMVSIRRMRDTEPALRIVFWFSLLASLASLPPAIWTRQLPPAETLWPMLGAGALAAIGQLMLTRAYALGTAARIGAIAYSVVLFSALLGWLFWDEVPDTTALIGGLLVNIACVLAGSWRRLPQ